MIGAAVRDMIASEKGEGSAPKQSPDWGTSYHFDDVVWGWQVWRLSNYTTYPDGRPFNEQPRALIETYFTLEREYAYQRFHMDAGNLDDGDDDAPPQEVIRGQWY